MISEPPVALQDLHQLDQAPPRVGVIGGEHDEGNPRVANRIKQLGLDENPDLHFVIVPELVDPCLPQCMEEVGRGFPYVLACEAHERVILPLMDRSRRRNAPLDFFSSHGDGA
ncbi:hypothetical protein NL676_008098 [Syzygium grande]|nr:hypothetical protein NL676_008098 [Syzygium grande]